MLSAVLEILMTYCFRAVGMAIFWAFSLGKVTGTGAPETFPKRSIFKRTKDGLVVHEDVAALTGLLVLVVAILLIVFTR